MIVFPEESCSCLKTCSIRLPEAGQIDLVQAWLCVKVGAGVVSRAWSRENAATQQTQPTQGGHRKDGNLGYPSPQRKSHSYSYSCSYSYSFLPSRTDPGAGVRVRV